MALSDNLIAYVPLTANDLPFTSNGHTFTATGATYKSTAPGPAWEITSSGGNISATDVTDGAPLTLAVMVYVPSSAPGVLAFMGRLLGDSDYWDMEMPSGTADLKARARSGGTAADATSAGSVTGSAFNNFAAVYTSSTSRQAYVNGTLGTAETTSVAPSGSAEILSIGALKRVSDVVQDLPTGWYVKHAAAWGRALTGAELDAYFSDPASVLGGGSSSGAAANYYRQLQG